MSNYLFVLANHRAKSKVQSWFSDHAPKASEFQEVPASRAVTLFVISHDLQRSLDVPRRTFFKGHMVDHGAGSVIFGLKGVA